MGMAVPFLRTERAWQTNATRLIRKAKMARTSAARDSGDLLPHAAPDAPTAASWADDVEGRRAGGEAEGEAESDAEGEDAEGGEAVTTGEAEGDTAVEDCGGGDGWDGGGEGGAGGGMVHVTGWPPTSDAWRSPTSAAVTCTIELIATVLSVPARAKLWYWSEEAAGRLVIRRVEAAQWLKVPEAGDANMLVRKARSAALKF